MMRIVYSLAALAAGATLVTGPAAARVPQPLLRLVGDGVRGSHFVPREVVRVTVSGLQSPQRLKLRATAAGTLSFALPMHDPCLESLVVLVRGASGDEVRLKLPQRACPPG
jgi:hypothetical protein